MKIWNNWDRLILTSDMERSSEIMPEKVLLMLMTSQRDVKVGLLYSCLNEIVSFSPWLLWHSFTKFHTQMHLGWVQNPVDFQNQRSNIYVTRSQDRSNGQRGVKSISIISQYMQSYRFSNQSNINIIYNISIITITNTVSIINILANFGKYAISDCPFILVCWCLNFNSMQCVAWHDIAWCSPKL